MNVIKEVLNDLPLEELVIDRIHRLSRPKHIPDTLPSNTIAHIHYYHIKEKLLSITRCPDQAPDCFHGLSLYAELYAYTMQRRRNLATNTKPFWNHKIMYPWNYPTKLIVSKEGRDFHIITVQEGLCLLKEWNILGNGSTEGHYSVYRAPNSHT